MKKINILPQGIRRVSGEQEAGPSSCDNMLNLRYEYRTLKSVGRKDIFDENTKYDKIYEHRLPNQVNMIGTYMDTTNDRVVYDINNDKEIYRYYPIVDDIDILFVNNLMVIKVYEDDLHENGPRFVTFVWNSNQYSLFYDGQLPDHPYYTVISASNRNELDTTTDVEFTDSKKFFDYVKSVINKLRLGNDDNYTQGAVLVCMNYTLFDGSETKPTAPRLVMTHDASLLQSNYSIEYKGDTSATMDLKVKLVTSRIEIFPDIDKDFYDKNKDIIKSINFYSTIPKPIYDLNNVIETYAWELDKFFEMVSKDTKNLSLLIGDTYSYNNDLNTITDVDPNLTLPIKKSDFDDFSNDIFYLQKVIPLTPIVEDMQKSFTLTMDETLLSRKIMNVDASGYLKYYGDALMYNNRLHLYNLRRKFVCGGSSLSWGGPNVSNTYPYNVTALVYIKVGTKDLKYCFSYVHYSYKDSEAEPANNLISFPDSRAYMAKLYYTDGNDQGRVTYGFSVPLFPSNTQNFAYFYTDNYDDYKIDATESDIPSIYDQELVYEDKDTVVVSNQSNPCYFDASSSYRIGGNITSLSVLTDGVSDLQIGRFPIAAFTDNGIFILEQGVGNVLYSNVNQISTIRSFYPTILTKMGVFFLADNGVYNLSGRIITRVSDIVEGNADNHLTDSEGYKACCDNLATYSVPILPDISEFCTEGTVFAYDDTEDELFISNTTLSNHSFVYTVKTQNWHSVDYNILFAKGKWAVNKFRGINNVIDLTTETFDNSDSDTQLIHIQTRALTFDSYDYKTIHRALSRCDVEVMPYSSGTGMLSMYIFGSNDIRNWYLIGATQFDNGLTDKLQIQKVASNYKYFIFIIGGYVVKEAELNSLEVLFSEKYSNKLR